MGDGKACQTTFKKEEQNPSIRTTTIVVQWAHEVDQPVTSISWVLTEKNKQCWHNVGGIDQHIVMCPSAEEEHYHGDGFEGVPSGKIGEAVNSILTMECTWNSITLKKRYDKCIELLKSGLADTTDREHVAYFYIWLRYSFSKQLVWQKRENTQPRNLCATQVALTDEMCE